MSRIFRLLVLLALFARVSQAQVPEVLKDLNPVASPQSLPFFTQSGSKIFFTRITQDLGAEPWVTDGTAAGTQLLKDIVPGAGMSLPAAWSPITVNGQPGAYFTAQTPTEGRELWITDGTPGGTKMVADINPGVPSAFSNGLIANKTLITDPAANWAAFAANDGAHGSELWQTTGAGLNVTASLVADIVAGATGSSPEELTYIPGSGIFFSASTAAAGREPWIWSIGLGQISDIETGSGSSDPKNFTLTSSGNITFTANKTGFGRELFKAGSATPIVDYIAGAASPNFFGFLSRGSSTSELFSGFVQSGASYTFTEYNSNASAITAVKTLPCLPGGPFTLSTPDYFVPTAIGNKAIFPCWDPSTQEIEPWVSDGTAGGTALLKDIYPGSGSSFAFGYINLGTRLLFFANDGTHGSEPWVTDGTAAGTTLLSDFNPGAAGSLPQDYAFAILLPVFSRTTSATLLPMQIGNAQKMYYTDGTAANTRELFDDGAPGSQGSNPADFKALGSKVLFRATDGSSGDELYSTDGTVTGTGLLKDIAPAGSSQPEDLHHFSNLIIFAANDPAYGWEPWITDGTAAGTVLLKDITPGAQTSSPEFFDIDLGGKTIFKADDGTSGLELWITDGTSAGTSLLKDIAPGSSSGNPRNLVQVGDKVYFTAATSTAGNELWVTDGTSTGTVMVKDIEPGSTGSNPSEVVTLNGKLYFTATDSHGDELWTSDGTDSGTTLVKDVYPGALSGIVSRLVSTGSYLFFAGDDGVRGSELWRSDGTEDGTVEVSNINPGAGDSLPSGITAVSDTRVIFSAVDGTHGEELWTATADLGSAELLKDIDSGPNSSSPVGFTKVAGTPYFYFSAETVALGRELYRTDGTAAGTELVADLIPGSVGSGPSGMYATRGRLYFGAAAPDSGSEPYVITVDACPDDAAKLAAGSCGCGVPDTDVNGNNVADCLYSDDIKALLTTLKTDLSKLSTPKNKKQRAAELLKRKELRTLVNQILAVAKQHKSDLKLKKGPKLPQRTASLKKAVSALYSLKAKLKSKRGPALNRAKSFLAAIK